VSRIDSGRTLVPAFDSIFGHRNGLFSTRTRAHTHWELIQEWLWEPSRGLPWASRRVEASRRIPREVALSMVTAGATANTAKGNSRASRESGGDGFEADSRGRTVAEG